MRRADRLFKIIQFLRSRHRAVTAKRIAEEFEISTRTVYRDIQDLVYSGVPILGEAGVGYIIDKTYYLPPITFNEDELEAISLGISIVRHWTDEKFAEKANTAFEKINAVLPADLQGELLQITTYSGPVEARPPWTVSFSDLRECIRARRKILFSYTDEFKQRTSRVVRPLALVFFSPVWVLACWCEKRNDFRNFRLDRIQNMKTCEDTFADEEDKNLLAYRAKEACF